MKLSGQTVEYYQKGYELSKRLYDYIGTLDNEFQNQPSLRLQRMAYTGLKIVTGKDIAACFRLVQEWQGYTEQITKTQDQKTVDVFLETVSNEKWMNFFDKFLSFIIQASLEAEKFLKTEAEKAEVEELFSRIGVNLVKTIINWFEENDTLKAILPQLNEDDQSFDLASIGLEPTIGLAALDQKKKSVGSG